MSAFGRKADITIGRRFPVRGGAACRVGDQSLEAAIDLAVEIPEGALCLDECLRQLRLSLHRENAIGYKKQAF